jgi:hypothetical protein
MTVQILRPRGAARTAAAGALLLLLGASAAAAQAPAAGGGPSAELRQACAADVRTLCPGVQPGGGALKACLRQNAAKVSPGCRTALKEARAARAAEKPAANP